MDFAAIGSDRTGMKSALDVQADKVVQRTRIESTGTTGTQPTAASRQDAKALKAGKDFESILLGSWLTQAENTFAKVPGGDDQDQESDSSNEQFQGIAMQALAGSLTASGGIGIAKMITKHLRDADNKDGAQAAVPLPESILPAARPTGER